MVIQANGSKKSLDSNYPSAVVDNYITRLALLQLQGNQIANESSKINNQVLIEKTLDVLEYDDPNAFLAMASSPIKFADYTTEETYAAWVILACKNGLPCDKNTRWLKMTCSVESACNDNSNALNMLQGQLSESVINRSKELVVKLEHAISNDWSELTPNLRDIDTQTITFN